LVNESW